MPRAISAQTCSDCEALDELLISVRIAKEAKAFKSFKSFQYAIEQVVSVCRQNEGWLRSLKKVS